MGKSLYPWRYRPLPLLLTARTPYVRTRYRKLVPQNHFHLMRLHFRVSAQPNWTAQVRYPDPKNLARKIIDSATLKVYIVVVISATIAAPYLEYGGNLDQVRRGAVFIHSTGNHSQFPRQGRQRCLDSSESCDGFCLFPARWLLCVYTLKHPSPLPFRPPQVASSMGAVAAVIEPLRPSPAGSSDPLAALIGWGGVGSAAADAWPQQAAVLCNVAAAAGVRVRKRELPGNRDLSTRPHPFRAPLFESPGSV